MKRIEHNVEHIVRIKGARVMADVAGLRVDVVGFTFGHSEFIEGNFIDLLPAQAIEKIKEELRDYSPVADAIIFDWNEVAK